MKNNNSIEIFSDQRKNNTLCYDLGFELISNQIDKLENSILNPSIYITNKKTQKDTDNELFKIIVNFTWAKFIFSIWFIKKKSHWLILAKTFLWMNETFWFCINFLSYCLNFCHRLCFSASSIFSTICNNSYCCINQERSKKD